MKQPHQKPDKISSEKLSRNLKPEEAELWHKVQRTVEPIDAKRQELKHWLDEMETVTPPTKATSSAKKTGISDPDFEISPIKQFNNSPIRPARKYEAAPYSPPVSRPAQTGSIDDRSAKKLLKGKISIDGRIDLHGMTQAQAHSTLLRFVMQSHASKFRMVMVITGKGRLSEGVLRNAVPNWLQEPVFSNYVSAFRTAHITHGGEGALYLRLRRNKGS